ncbi:MAG: DUF2666 domain-containing protein [Candidatus Micrarchaeota archaeon]|nr:DUF2666 domain-containing protein [Candidatus Micrarchaeota archaeon]
MEEEEISFFAKYKDWVVIKKKQIDEKTEEKEILAILASINSTTARKAFDFAPIDKGAIDNYVAEITKGKRKGLNNLAEIFGSIKQSELRERLVSACKDKEETYYPFAETYFIYSVLKALNYSPFIGSETVQEVYPEMKMPKPRGRMPKK